MNFSKRLFVFATALLLVLSLFACNSTCTEHNDSDGDGKCDVCDTVIPSPDSCTEHIDEDNNARCDRCGHSLVNPDNDTPEDEVP